MSADAAGDSNTVENLADEIARLKLRLADLEGDENGHHGPYYFDQRLKDEIDRSTRYNYEFSVLLIQLDNLELFSHKAGEASTQEVLGMFSTIIRESFRKTDICCKFAPDKFGFILPYTGASGVRIVAQRIRQRVERVFNFKSLSVKIALTLSTGSATYQVDAVSSDHLMKMLGDALAKAQANGGNCSVTAGDSQQICENGMNSMRETHDEFLIHAMDDEVLRCSRYGQKFALLMMAFRLHDNEKERTIDLKQVRAVLQTVIKTTVRTLDKHYPHGELKYALLLPGTDSEGAMAVAQKLMQAITAVPLSLSNSSEIEVALNIGIAAFPSDEVSREGLLKRAEAALNESLKRGDNNIAVASALVKSTSKKSWDVQDWVAHLKNAESGALYNMVASLDMTQQYARPHSQAVARYAMVIGQAMGLTATAMRQLRTIALFHDLGMICLPAEIVTRPGRLTAREWQSMLNHPELGAALLSQFTEFAYCVQTVRSHHERWDGKGYPAGLKGDQIPPESRIIAVAEALDDMVTARPYKQRLPMSEAIEELKRNAGTQFDPAMVQNLIKAAYQMQTKPGTH